MHPRLRTISENLERRVAGSGTTATASCSVTISRPSAAPPPTSVIVMGVSGAGKSVVAQALAESTGWMLAEGDDFHPAANVEKMRSGGSASRSKLGAAA